MHLEQSGQCIFPLIIVFLQGSSDMKMQAGAEVHLRHKKMHVCCTRRALTLCLELVWKNKCLCLCGQIFYVLFLSCICVCVPVCTCVKQWKRDVIQSWQVKAVKHWGHTWRERRCLTGWKCHSEEERMFRRWGMRREMQSGSRQRCNRPICLWCNGEKMVWHGW